MAFTASYTVTQSANGTSLVITDTSSYTSEPQSGFNYRRLYVYYVDGTALVFPSGSILGYIDFPFAGGNSITITGFVSDLSLNVGLVLNKTVPVSGSTYSSYNIVTMTGYTNAAIYSASQILSINPIRLSDPVFKDSLVQLHREKITAINAGNYGDQFSAQAALGRASDIISQSNIRF